MGRIINKISLLLAVIVTGLFSAVPGMVSAAGSATMSLSPNGGSYKVGTTFSATVYENSGSDPVNVIEADFGFDHNRIQLVGISCNTGAFEITAPGNGSGITCGTTSPKTGNQAVAFAKFKALANGSAVVNFALSSHVYNSSNADIWNGSVVGANYSFFVPVAVAKPAPPQVQAAVTPPAPEPVKTEVVKTPTPVVASVKEAPKKMTSMAYSVAFIVLVVLAVIATAKSEELGAWLGTQRKKLMATNGSSLATPAVAVAASKKASSKKKSSTKKSNTKKKSTK